MRIDQISPITGEFLLDEPERSFRAERLTETVRQACIVFGLAAILNFVYLISEWRFHDEASFLGMVPARSLVIVLALGCWASILRAGSFAAAEKVMLVGAIAVAPMVAMIVNSHSHMALFASIMLPCAYWLVLPISFFKRAAVAIYCGVMMLLSYLWGASDAFTIIGLCVVTLLLNGVLAVAIIRANRLSRQEWAANRRELQAREELAESRHTLQRMLLSVPVPLLVVSKIEGRLVHANQAAIEFLGGHPDQIGMHFLSDLRADLSQPVRSLEATEEAPQRFEGIIRTVDGSTRNVLVVARVLKLDAVDNVLVAMIDITDRKLLERRLERLAATDALTGLANRAGFFAAAQQEFASPERQDRQPALLMVDLDHFKQINDTYGHETGDAVLRSFARLCRRLFRSRDIIGRIGGEEFAILLPQTNLESALARAERLRQGAEKLRFRGRASELRVTTSIGVAQILPEEGTVDAALSRADRALYRAKRAGRNRIAGAGEASLLSDVA
jgi:diguanylate cyclase (GGDEF)-like protein/PAS domain S-box-containing protein